MGGYVRPITLFLVEDDGNAFSNYKMVRVQGIVGKLVAPIPLPQNQYVDRIGRRLVEQRRT